MRDRPDDDAFAWAAHIAAVSLDSSTSNVLDRSQPGGGGVSSQHTQPRTSPSPLCWRAAAHPGSPRSYHRNAPEFESALAEVGRSHGWPLAMNDARHERARPHARSSHIGRGLAASEISAPCSSPGGVALWNRALLRDLESEAEAWRFHHTIYQDESSCDGPCSTIDILTNQRSRHAKHTPSAWRVEAARCCSPASSATLGRECAEFDFSPKMSLLVLAPIRASSGALGAEGCEDSDHRRHHVLPAGEVRVSSWWIGASKRSGSICVGGQVLALSLHASIGAR